MEKSLSLLQRFARVVLEQNSNSGRFSLYGELSWLDKLAIELEKLGCSVRPIPTRQLIMVEPPYPRVK